jgi:hypothetical protein
MATAAEGNIVIRLKCPESTWRRVKILAAQQGTTANAIVLDAIKPWLRDAEKARR